MTQFFHARSLRYEIQALIDDRWQVVSVIDDGREKLGRDFDAHDFQRLETDVRAQAEQILKKPTVSAIRVTRDRRRSDRWSGSEEIYQAEKPAIPKKPRFRDYDSAVPFCETPEDLLRRSARRLIGVMLRPLLDELSLTPLELLTVDGATKTVERASDTFAVVMMRVAQRQSQQDGGDLRTRLANIEAMVATLRGWIKNAERNPAADVSLFGRLRNLCLTVRKAQGSASIIEILVEMAVATESSEDLVLIDGYLADLFDHPMVVQEVLGQQRDLHTALRALFALTQGIAPQTNPMLSKLGKVIRRGVLPETVASLFDRIQQSLKGEVPLTHGDLSAEWTAVDQVFNDFLPRLPQPIIASALAAVKKRRDALQLRAVEMAEAT